MYAVLVAGLSRGIDRVAQENAQGSGITTPTGLPTLWEREQVVRPNAVCMRLDEFDAVRMFSSAYLGSIPPCVAHIGNSILSLNPIVDCQPRASARLPRLFVYPSYRGNGVVRVRVKAATFFYACDSN